MRTSLATATAALALFSAPVADASENVAAAESTTVETTTVNESESTGFGFYSSFARDFADEFRCSTSPQRWWCGG